VVEGEKRRSTPALRPSTILPVKISIVVPAFNEERLLGDSLAEMKTAAKAFMPLGWEWELVVCDNNSTDRTAEIARAAGARVVFEPVNQIARARNAGATAATGEWLIFIDADSHPSEALFADVAEAIRSGKYLAGGATVRMDREPLAAKIMIPIWTLISRTLKWCAGSFIFCEASAFREIGGFSNELYMAEELDLSRRLKRLAKKNRKRIVILARHPLITSARKLKLYSMREHLWLLFRVLVTPRRTMTRRENAHLWYDGRR